MDLTRQNRNIRLYAGRQIERGKKCTITGLWSRSPEKETHVRSSQKSNGDLCGNFVLMGITISQAFMLPGFLLALLYLFMTYLARETMNISWKRTTDHRCNLWQKYRKTAHVLNLEEMEVTAPHYHEKVAKYKKNAGTEKLKNTIIPLMKMMCLTIP